MHIFRHIFLSNYWWQRSDIWSQASYRYPISWEAFFDPSDSYFLFAEERGYHKWAQFILFFLIKVVYRSVVEKHILHYFKMTLLNEFYGFMVF